MRQRTTKFLLILLAVVTTLRGQDSEIDLLVKGELKMTFPSIYFKTNSTDYAVMPYTIDSCFKYIAFHFKDNINALSIWRDSTETEELTNKRIEKLKAELKKYITSKEINIHSMDKEQKISRRTINSTTDSAKVQYLLSLNSVFDISKTRFTSENKSSKEGHIDHPRIWCLKCWRNHRFSKEYRRMSAARKQNKTTSENTDKKKKRRHLVWTGWKTGFHWSTP